MASGQPGGGYGGPPPPGQVPYQYQQPAMPIYTGMYSGVAVVPVRAPGYRAPATTPRDRVTAATANGKIVGIVCTILSTILAIVWGALSGASVFPWELGIPLAAVHVVGLTISLAYVIVAFTNKENFRGLRIIALIWIIVLILQALAELIIMIVWLALFYSPAATYGANVGWDIYLILYLSAEVTVVSAYITFMVIVGQNLRALFRAISAEMEPGGAGAANLENAQNRSLAMPAVVGGGELF